MATSFVAVFGLDFGRPFWFRDAANYPVHISRGSRSRQITYGPSHQRIRQRAYENGVLKRTTVSVDGLYRQEIAADGTITYQHHIRALGHTVAIHSRSNDGSVKTQYLHRDHLGSVAVISNEDGDLTARMSYGAFGQRRDPGDWTGPAQNPAPDSTDRGYTGHEMLDGVGLIHMNGRVYDPGIGRFVSADPIVQAPQHSQSYNRYSYVWNNPLSAFDPSGFVAKQGDNQANCSDLECLKENYEEELEKAKDVAKGLSSEYAVVVYSNGTFSVVKVASSPNAVSEASREAATEGVEREVGATAISGSQKSKSSSKKSNLFTEELFDVEFQWGLFAGVKLGVKGLVSAQAQFNIGSQKVSLIDGERSVSESYALGVDVGGFNIGIDANREAIGEPVRAKYNFYGKRVSPGRSIHEMLKNKEFDMAPFIGFRGGRGRFGNDHVVNISVGALLGIDITINASAIRRRYFSD